MGTYPFSQPQGQFWVTTECQCQKNRNKTRCKWTRKKKSKWLEREQFTSLQIHFRPLFWMKSVTMNSSLIYGTNLNNLNRRSRVHQIAVGLLFPCWCLISLKDHSPKAYTAMKLKGGGGERRNRKIGKESGFLWSHKNSHTVQQRSPPWLKIHRSNRSFRNHSLLHLLWNYPFFTTAPAVYRLSFLYPPRAGLMIYSMRHLFASFFQEFTTL